MTKDEIENAKPIAQLIDGINQINEAAEAIIERDIKHGLYKLKAGPRKEQVKLLADQGLSNRQIAKVVGADEATIRRDLSAANAALNTANAAPESSEEIKKLIEKSKAEAKAETMKEVNEKLLDIESKLASAKLELKKAKDYGENRAEYISKIERAIDEMARDKKDLELRLKNKQGPDLGKQIQTIINPVTNFLQSDELAKKIHDLEAIKEMVELDHDMASIAQLVHELRSLSERAITWANRITPVNDRWNFHKQKEN